MSTPAAGYDLAITLKCLNSSKIMPKDIHSTKLKQIGSPYFQFTVKNVQVPALSMSLILFYLFSFSVVFYCSDTVKQTDAQVHAKKLMPSHAIQASHYFRCLTPSAQYCELSSKFWGYAGSTQLQVFRG